jgi:NADH-quinone oxidoreductase subunit G
MPTIHIDQQAYTVKDGENLLQACLALGLNLPYFCWHPALGSVGACRQCAVKQFKDPNDERGKIVMACVTPVVDGARLSIQDAEASAFRADVIEWLMINHPHDCPVCDEGGECHLQDMTVLTGHVKRRYSGLKRTFRNQHLGPFVNHEMNRCIQCYRCVRYYRDYAGGHDLDAQALRGQVYFGRAQDGALESEFSGNLVEVCPTGVFTDKTLTRHYTRKWDLQSAPSVCVHCGVGCNTLPGERYGTLRRVHNRYNGQVNGYFLCDRGRYGYEFVNGPRRILSPMSRRGRGDAPDRLANMEALDKQQALAQLVAMLPGEARVVGIGSPRASLEANFALRTLVGRERFHLGMSDREAGLVAAMLGILRSGPAHTPSLREVGQADAVLVLGEDVSNTAPMLALALRQSAKQQPRQQVARLRIPDWDAGALGHATQHARGPLFVASVAGTRLDEIATATLRGAPDELARLGFAVAHALDANAPAPAGLDPRDAALAATIAEALRAARSPLVVSGAGCGSAALIEAAANVASALRAGGKPAQLCYAMPECNSLGLAMMGGEPLGAALQGGERTDVVIVLENDLYRRAATPEVDAFLAAARQVIVIDHTAHATSARADLLLPAASFAESDGTLVNHEGRAQRFFQVFTREDEVQESWRWARDLMAAGGRAEECRWQNLDQLIDACVAALPALAGIRQAAPSAAFRLAGRKIPRQPQGYSGRTATRADVSVHERPPPDDPDAPLAFSMEGAPGAPPPPLIPIFWAPHWNSHQAVHKFQDEPSGALRGGDPGVRLIEIEPGAEIGYFSGVPAPFQSQARGGAWLLVPLHHVFGGEELSAQASGVAELAPRPYLALHPDDAAELGLRDGDPARLQLDGGAGLACQLPLQLHPGLWPGTAGLPVGLPDLSLWAGLAAPAWCRISKAEAA